MAIVIENIDFSKGELFRLGRWRGGSTKFFALDPNGCSRPQHGFGGRWHSHPEMEFTVITRGRGVRYVGDHVEPFDAWDCVLLCSNLPHCWTERGPSDGYVLQFRIPSEWVLHRSETTELSELLKASSRGLSFSRAVAREAVALIRMMATGPPLVRAGLFIQLLGHLHAAMASEAKPITKTVLAVSSDQVARSRMESVVHWILENLGESLPLGDAVELAAMSRATFSRQFKRYTGKTFIEFVGDVRLAEAHQLILTSPRPVSDIAYASGFGSLSQFNAKFRAHFGANPRELRLSIRKR